MEAGRPGLSGGAQTACVVPWTDHIVGSHRAGDRDHIPPQWIDDVLVLAEDGERGQKGKTQREGDGTAIELWDALAEPRTVEQLVAELGRVYGVSSAAIGADVLSSLTALRRHGLISR